MSSAMSSNTVEYDDILQLSHIHGKHHRAIKVKNSASALAKGQFHLTKTVSDVLIHMSDMREIETASVTCERSAELTIGVLLEGKLQFALGETEVTLEVAPGESPVCFGFNALRPISWRRDLIENNHVKKALVCLSHEWLQKRFRGQSELDAFIQAIQICHAWVLTCDADSELNNSANAMLECGKKHTSEFELEGLALTLMVKCLKTLKSHYRQEQNSINNMVRASPESLKICQFVEEHILFTNPPVQPNLGEIAKRLGTSISTAQRQFKKDFQQTIMDYIRTKRLEIARNQLLNQLSIGEAAYLAGYSHPSNFSLAFKKYFGISPGDLTGPSTAREKY